MTVKRGKKSESDREKRLAQALGESRYVNILYHYARVFMKSPQYRGRSPSEAMLAL